ncbi:methyltransferase domain-containing protein [Pseudomonas gingeri]|uniref:rhamnan synthesis F family protein n=1 Tax=Pseudomonas gingeri TaxID=117681 RepID=UPI0015A35EF1|nr:rhamnan synthesis F family protein [Pseudomonas gingeri]NVZ62046.1 methyltransferase domain-containing protein [Pseudomonas gingeri]NVZ78214.1 methyltransferase domain-containing protein [Pseudomonas gingeri]
MHPSAMLHGRNFIESIRYPDNRKVQVVEVGAQDVNGSLRAFIPDRYHYTGCDFIEGKNVDLILDDPYCLPFDDDSVDVVIASSCFEHSDMFWLVFLEILRVLKTDGLFYLNTPSNGYVHRHPVDSWRFYPDSGQSLVRWARRNGYSALLIESFIGAQLGDRPEERWSDYVCVFGKSPDSISHVGFHLSDKVERASYLQRHDLCFQASDPAEPEDILNILSLEARNDALKRQVTVLESECATLATRTEGLEQANETLRGRVSELMGMNDELLASRSWRLTAPLRLIKQLLTRSSAAGPQLAQVLRSFARAVYRRAPAYVRPWLLKAALRLFGRRSLQWSRDMTRGSVSAGRGTAYSLDYRELAEKARSNRPAGRQSVAVVIHVFYPDVFEEMAHYFPNLGQDCHFYITVADEVSRASVVQVLGRQGIDCYELRVCPNRGRNFAPWLVEYRQQIRSHDLMLHLHTKKSLRTGEDQKSWRTHLFNCLLGSSAVVELIRGIYRDRPQAGVIAPETYEQGASYWFHHWLSVGHLLPAFFSRLKIASYPRRGLMDFPVGAMFWARVASLRPLLEVDWAYDDFEPEPAADDGTLPHVIERAIGVIAEQAGYIYGEINPRAERFLWGGSSKLLDQYLVTSRRIQDADGFPVVSFDFFDTLFSRVSVSPEDVQHYIGFELARRCDVSAAQTFYSVRKTAEARARVLSKSGEVGLSEIYRCFAFFGWDDELSTTAMALELEIERRCLVPRRAVLDVLVALKRQGKRVIIVSDSYFERTFFLEVLKQFDVLSLVDEIYVSCEVGHRKDRGDIWPYLTRLEGGAIRHIGDNEQADIQQALRNGLSPVGILNPAVLAQERGLTLPPGWREADNDWRDGIALGPVVQSIANNPLLDKGFKPIALTSLVDVGYVVYGPLIMAFLNGLCTTLVAGRYDRVLFLARDGFYLKEIFDRHYAPLCGIRTEYFFCSRQSLLAVLWGQGIEVEDLFQGGRFSGTLNALLKARLGFAVAGSDEFIVLPGDEARVRKHVQKHHEAISHYCTGQMDAFSAYVGTQGIEQTERYALVDLGYAGTIQYRLQKILKRPLDGFYMNTNLAAQQVVEDGGRIQGFFNDALHLNRPMQPVEAHSLALEAVFTAPHPQVVGYTLAAADAEVQTRIVFSDKAQPALDLVHAVQEGVGKYFSSLLDAYGRSVLTVDFSPMTAQSPFELMIEGGMVLPEAFSCRFKVEDDFCGNGELNVSQFLGLRVSGS